MLCSHCNEKPVFARSLCQACYYRLRRRGTVEKVNIQNLGMTCSVDGCANPAHARGLCAHHYAKAEHQLKPIWRTIRSRYPGEVPASWDRFSGFLADVGERPSPKHQLRRVDQRCPWSAQNLRWLAPVNPNQSWRTPEERSSYQRAQNLLRRFNLEPDDYAAMLTAQNGVCAICGQAETHHYSSGTLKGLAVDHDRETGAVRELLCFNCNQGLGRFKHSVERLERAADYMRRHAPIQLANEEA